MSEEVTLDEFTDTSDTEDSQERVRSRFWGQIPEYWQLVNGSEVYDVNPNPKPEEEPNSYIEMDALDTELPWPKYSGMRDASDYSGKTFTKGDTLFARITPCTENGKAAIVPEMETEVGIGSTEYAVLSPNRDSINPWLLYYLGKSHTVHNYAVSRMRGSTGRQRVPFSLFRRELDVALPPLPEQRKIATVLYTVDRAIEKTEEIIQSVGSLKTGLIQQLTTRGIGNNEFKKIHVSLGYLDVEVPISWEKITYEHISTNITYGFTSPMPEAESGPWMITAKDINDGRIDYREARKTTEEAFSETLTSKSRPEPGTVLITKDGTLGNVAVVEKEGICINQSVASINPIEEKIHPEFLALALKSPLAKKQIKAYNPQTTIGHIKISELAKWELALPPIEEQEQIISIVESIRERESTSKEYKERLQRLKRGLMQDLLSGTVRTTDTNIEVPDEIAQYG
jgi:type I restriction enzyme S subunit